MSQQQTIDQTDITAFWLVVLLGGTGFLAYYFWNLMADWQSIRNPVLSFVAGYYYTLLVYPLEIFWNNTAPALSLVNLMNKSSDYSLIVQLSILVRQVAILVMLGLGYVLFFSALPKKLSLAVLFGPLLISIVIGLFRGAAYIMPYLV